MNIPKNTKQALAALLLVVAAPWSSAQVSHPAVGTRATSADGGISLELTARKQYFDPKDTATADPDINSPKSVNIHPDGTKYYVNSLEGATTVVYDMARGRKLKVIRHKFDQTRHAHLWSEPSGFYPFTHYKRPDPNTFDGKPVESAFTHNGRYLWVPYYRRSFDINAQDPSAVAIIDTRTDRIARLMETGPLPKMIAPSPDGTLVAIAHWGDNTVGIIDISSPDPRQWRHKACHVVDYKLRLDFSLTETVDRDNGSGYALRGTVFTPDNHYLLVGCMGGGGGIAVIDLRESRYLGRLTGMMRNVRHLVLGHGSLYLSVNASGYVQRIPLSAVLDGIGRLRTSPGRTAALTGWKNCKVGNGARTIALSPSGRYIFAACNTASALYVVDARAMTVAATIPADSYPVGLDVSRDGRRVLLTSQGRSNKGGNAVDIFAVNYNRTAGAAPRTQDTPPRAR